MNFEQLQKQNAELLMALQNIARNEIAVFDEAEGFDVLVSMEPGELADIARAAIEKHVSPTAANAVDRVTLPTSADQAAGMVLLGRQWLEQNAPERLRKPAEKAGGLSQLVVGTRVSDGYVTIVVHLNRGLHTTVVYTGQHPADGEHIGVQSLSDAMPDAHPCADQCQIEKRSGDPQEGCGSDCHIEPFPKRPTDADAGGLSILPWQKRMTAGALAHWERKSDMTPAEDAMQEEIDELRAAALARPAAVMADGQKEGDA